MTNENLSANIQRSEPIIRSLPFKIVLNIINGEPWLSSMAFSQFVLRHGHFFMRELWLIVHVR